MTLTAILPSLRRTLPDPLRASSWPQHSHATTTDVVVAGVSMLRLAELCESPCVHSGDAANPAANRNPALRQSASVVIVRVTAVLTNFDAERVVLIDACLDSVSAIWDETRLIGRVSTLKATTAIVLSGEAHRNPCEARHLVALPADLGEGDLLAIPCAGAVALRDIRPAAGADRGQLPDAVELPEVPSWLALLA